MALKGDLGPVVMEQQRANLRSGKGALEFLDRDYIEFPEEDKSSTNPSESAFAPDSQTTAGQRRTGRTLWQSGDGSFSKPQMTWPDAISKNLESCNISPEEWGKLEAVLRHRAKKMESRGLTKSGADAVWWLKYQKVSGVMSGATKVAPGQEFRVLEDIISR